MSKYLIALIWPVGLAVIAGAALLLARRYQAVPAVAGDAGRAGRHSHGGASRQVSRAAAAEAGMLGTLAVLGAAVVFGLMCLLGVLVTHGGLGIDRPVFNLIQGHHEHIVKALMKRLTKIGDTWTTWGAAAAAAACLAVTWRSRRWVPPVSLAVLIVVDHYTTLALRHVFHRLGPPTSPLGTFPSGGCDRSIVFYGLIAYLLWREFSGQRSTAMLAGGAVAALGFNEAFSRVYLSLHWFTDAVSGLVYGTLLLAVFIVAVRVVAGRPASRTDPPAAPWRPVPAHDGHAHDGPAHGGPAQDGTAWTPWPTR